MVGEGGREGVVVLGLSFSFWGSRSRSWALVISEWGVVVIRGGSSSSVGDRRCPWALLLWAWSLFMMSME